MEPVRRTGNLMQHNNNKIYSKKDIIERTSLFIPLNDLDEECRGGALKIYPK